MGNYKEALKDMVWQFAYRGAVEWVVAQGGMWAETGYWCLCNEHCDESRKGNPQPKMKQRAIDREASRDKNTGRLPVPNS